MPDESGKNQSSDWFYGEAMVKGQMNEEELEFWWKRHIEHKGFLHWEEFRDKVGQAYIELTNIAKNVPYKEMPITYGRLGVKIGIPPITDWFPLKMAYICGVCSEYEHSHNRPLISALVINEESNRPGKGFWGLSGIPTHLKKGVTIGDMGVIRIDDIRENYWVDQLKQIDKFWKTKKSE